MKGIISNTLFVTGTDTSVGKTYVCARFLEFLKTKGIQAGYQKWVATGVNEKLPDDLAFCINAGSIPATPDVLDQQVPYCFRFPASPHLAAEMEDRTVDPEVIAKNYKSLPGMSGSLSKVWEVYWCLCGGTCFWRTCWP